MVKTKGGSIMETTLEAPAKTDPQPYDILTPLQVHHILKRHGYKKFIRYTNNRGVFGWQKVVDVDGKCLEKRYNETHLLMKVYWCVDRWEVDCDVWPKDWQSDVNSSRSSHSLGLLPDLSNLIEIESRAIRCARIAQGLE